MFVLYLLLAAAPAPVCNGLVPLMEPADMRRPQVSPKVEAAKDPVQRAEQLYGIDTPQSLVLLNRVLRDQPRHGPALLLRARIQMAQRLLNVDGAKRDAEAFEAACPNSLLRVAELARVKDLEWLRQRIERMRQRLAERVDLEALAGYPVVWQWESAAYRSDDAVVVERWRRDWERLRKPDVERSMNWLNAVRAIGFKMGWDTQWAREEVGKRYPHSADATTMKALAIAKGGATEETVAQFRRLHREYPAATGVPAVWIQTVRGRKQWMEEASLAMLKAMEINPNGFLSLPPYELIMASELLEADLMRDQLTQFVFQGISAIERRTGKEARSDLYDGDEDKQAANWYVDAFQTLLRHYTRTQRWAEGKDVIAQLDSKMAVLAPKDVDPLESKMRFRRMRAEYLRYRGDYYAGQDKHELALASYREAMLTYPPRSSRGDGRELAAAGARKSAKAIGETEEDWQAWVQRHDLSAFSSGVGQANAWAVLEASHADLKVKDMLGREFTPGQLKVMKSVVTLWATWCGPCRAELPYLERLAKEMKDQENVAVVALNVDEQPERTGEFLKSMQFTFGNNLAQDYAYRMLPVMALPANYLMDAKGTTSIYIDAAGEKWLAGMREKLRSH